MLGAGSLSSTDCEDVAEAQDDGGALWEDGAGEVERETAEDVITNTTATITGFFIKQ